jgi:hypothetical protein
MIASTHETYAPPSPIFSSFSIMLRSVTTGSYFALVNETKTSTMAVKGEVPVFKYE